MTENIEKKLAFNTFDPERSKSATIKPPEQEPGPTEINPYIPQFISKAPWYLEQDGDTSLQHQRLREDRDQKEKDLKDVWYKRGVKAGPASTKYRKGACENCGAMTHKAKDCMERPRKVGAKYTGQNIQADDLIQNIPMTWDSKRDKWNGYDVSQHIKVVEEYQQLEDLRRKATEDQAFESKDLEADSEDNEHFGTGPSTRSLRVREDTASYLKNLNSDAEYNPKSRKMNNDDSLLASEDDFVHKSDDQAMEFERLKQFAWDATEKGIAQVSVEANPTEGALLKRKLELEESEKSVQSKKQLLDKYGGSEYIRELPKELKVKPDENYVEYSAGGDIIKGKATAVPRSQYEEDVFPGNHTTVWGSWWIDFKWGYACCHSTIKQSYCTGEAGIRALNEKVI
ncbi:Pre-mRNA splicing Prp18-interacting factor-domain-containing protein [Lipomyces oligophaga]|uniref:Pre-mRNA splicing Prp18-interacting factor-domain-containing protein n=1 Tax=Lipomyces oligophaga TaxID=45792 RepID=UPI0034CD5B17